MLEQSESNPLITSSENLEHLKVYAQRIKDKIEWWKGRAIKEIEENPDKPTDEEDLKVLIMEKIASHFLSDNDAGFLGEDKKWFFSHADPETKEYILECYIPSVITRSLVELAKKQQEDDLTQRGLSPDERRKIESEEYQIIKILEAIEEIVLNDLKNYYQDSRDGVEKIMIANLIKDYENIESYLDMMPESEDVSKDLQQRIGEFKKKIEVIKNELASQQ